jgi:Glycosyl transferase family 2
MNELPKISLCIPTLGRFDKFLSKNLPNYLENNYIDEIVISDEDGDDIQKIGQTFKDETGCLHPKLKLFSNEKILGAFLNKEKVVSLAKNDWIALIDSDNYAPPQYFEAWEKHIAKVGLDNNMIYMPSGWLNNSCNFFNRLGQECNSSAPDPLVFTKHNVRNYFDDFMWNTGNYIVNKNSYLGAKNNYEYLIPLCYSLDVVYKNAILLENDINFSLVENMMYEHAFHDESYYIKTNVLAEPHRKDINSIYLNFEH